MPDATHDGDGPDEMEPPTSGQNGGSSSGAGQSPAGRPTRPLEFPEMTAECEPGFRSNGAGERSCNYTFDGLCYENEDAACACACPGALCIIAGRQTVSNQPIAVRCQARP